MTKEIRELPEGMIIPFATRYLITKHGDVYNISRKTKRKLHENNGYLSVRLVLDSGLLKSFLVHRLVAMVFIHNPENKPHVNHINSNRSDNRLTNLEWVTPKENTKHSIENGFRDFRLDKHPRTNLTKEMVIDIYNRLLNGEASIRLAEEYGVTPSCVADISKRRSWKECTESLPDIGDLSIKTRLSDDVVHGVCQKLVEKKTARHIVKSIGEDKLTIHQVYDIKRRRYCKEISSHYKW